MRTASRRIAVALLGTVVAVGAVVLIRPAAAALEPEAIVPGFAAARGATGSAAAGGATGSAAAGGATGSAAAGGAKATRADSGTVPLVVGVRSGADPDAPVDRLADTTDIDILDQGRVAGLRAATVDVAAADRPAAVAALRRHPDVSYVEVDHVRRASDVLVNDPDFDLQWGLPRMRVPTAWEASTGSSEVTIAVIDSGVTAGSELAGALVAGYDFVNRDTNASDDYGHGTLVAKLAAAGANEGVGGAGVCWTCRIMPVKVLDANGDGFDSDVAADLRWAADHGADIINLSLGGEQASTLLESAVTYAQSRGVLVIAAAGNAGTSTKQYPAAIPSVLAVGASGLDDERLEFSSYGSWVDVAAPGWCWEVLPDGSAEPAAGTSFASPLVAGAAALALSASPSATATQIGAAITTTATPIGSWISAGRVDAAAAVAALPATAGPNPSVRLTGPAARAAVRGTVAIKLVASADVASAHGIVDGVDIGTDTAAPWALSWNTGTTTGARTVTLVVADASGNAATVTLPLAPDNTKPKITGATPKQAAKVRGTVTIGATGVSDVGSGISHASLYVDGKYIGRDTTSGYAVKYNTGKRNGTVKIQWRLFDKAGNMATYDRSVIADNTKPKVKITKAPKDKAKIKGKVKITVAASDYYGVNRVELLINGKIIAKDVKTPYTFSITASKHPKKLKVQVRAYDNAGNVTYDKTRNWKR